MMVLELGVQPTVLEPGIYFGLEEDMYHEDPAVSRSCIKELIRPGKYWKKSVLNPNRIKRKRTREMEFGSMLHLVLLEPDLFYENYRCVPGDPVDNRIPLQRAEYKQLIAMANVIRSTPDVAKYLSFGAPEVTLVCRDPVTGVMLRSRHDWFSTWYSLDYKSVSGLEEVVIKGAVRKYYYKVQTYMYGWMRQECRRLLNAGEIDFYGTPPKGFIEKFKASPDSKEVFFCLLQEKDDPYCFDLMYLGQDDLDEGFEIMRERIDVYAFNLNKYGADTPWPEGVGTVREFSSRFGYNKIVEKIHEPDSAEEPEQD